MHSGIQHLLRLGPHNNAHLVAMRAALSIAIPLLTLWLVDRLDLSLYVAFGAFTSLYGRTHTHLPRLRMQASAAVWLVCCVTLGAVVATSPDREWLVIPVVAVVAALGSVLSDGLSWHPPGPIFAVFGVAAVASVPAGAERIPLALALSAGSAALAVLIGVAGFAHPRARQLPESAPSISFRAVLRKRETHLVATRFTLAVVIAGSIPTLSGWGHPYWAMVGAVAAVSGPSPQHRLERGAHRILGTSLGVLIAAAIFAFEPSALISILIVVILQGGAELLVGRNYGLASLCITPLALVMVRVAHPVPASVLVWDRFLETLLGAAVGILMTLWVIHRQRRLAA